MQVNDPQPKLHTFYKSQLEMDHRSECKARKLLGKKKKNRGENLCDLMFNKKSSQDIERKLHERKYVMN